MPERPSPRLGDRCPQCAGLMERDPAESDAALEAKFAPAGNAAAREAYIAKARFKQAAHGTLIRCVDCGYQARATTSPPPPPRAASEAVG